MCSPSSGCCDKHNCWQWNSVLRSYTRQAVYFSVRYVSMSLEFWGCKGRFRGLGWGARSVMSEDVGPHTHTHTQPFYDPFSGTTQVNRCQKRTSGLYGARGKINRDRNTDRPARRRSIRTNQCPPLPLPWKKWIFDFTWHGLVNSDRYFLKIC